MSWSKKLVSNSVTQTLEIGRALGAALREGDVLGLIGELGAGKTHLAKGLARGLGVDDDRLVTSPTFVLVNEYEGRCLVHHLDAYRLRAVGDIEALGFEEMCDSGAVMLVEWADRVAEAMPERTLWIRMRSTGETVREMQMETTDADLAQRLASTSLDPCGT